MDLTVYDVALIPAIVGLIQVAKGLGLPHKFSPILGIVLGIVAGTVFVYPDDIKGGILVGIMIGLSTSGLYSGTKNTVEAIKNDNDKININFFK